MITAHPTEVRRKTVLDHVEPSPSCSIVGPRAATARPNSQRSTTAAAGSADALADRRGPPVEAAGPRRDQRGAALLPIEHLRDGAGAPARSRSTRRVRPVGHELHNPRAISMGSWIGGDRDGNPYVTADVLRLAVEAQATEALRPAPRALTGLSRELSMSARLITPTRGAALARRRLARRLAVPRR